MVHHGCSVNICGMNSCLERDEIVVWFQRFPTPECYSRQVSCVKILAGGKAPVGGTVDTTHHVFPKATVLWKAGCPAFVFGKWGSGRDTSGICGHSAWKSSSLEMRRGLGQRTWLVNQDRYMTHLGNRAGIEWGLHSVKYPLGVRENSASVPGDEEAKWLPRGLGRQSKY